MKPQKFKPGDKVTPAMFGSYWGVASTAEPAGTSKQLKTGEIYTVANYAGYDYNTRAWYVVLAEKDPQDAYDEQYLEKVEELTEEIKELLEECITV